MRSHACTHTQKTNNTTHNTRTAEAGSASFPANRDCNTFKFCMQQKRCQSREHGASNTEGKRRQKNLLGLPIMPLAAAVKHGNHRHRGRPKTHAVRSVRCKRTVLVHCTHRTTLPSSNAVLKILCAVKKCCSWVDNETRTLLRSVPGVSDRWCVSVCVIENPPTGGRVLKTYYQEIQLINKIY